MFEKKQNVFDDFFAAARVPDRQEVHGHGAPGDLRAVERRPADGRGDDAASGAVRGDWCGYPLLDMLRYQNFEVGRLWTTEYGSADNEAQYTYLLSLLAVPEREAGNEVSGDHVLYRRQRHARRSAARAQDDGADAGRRRAATVRSCCTTA